MFKKFLILISIMIIFSCSDESDKKYPMFVNVGVLKEWNMPNLKVNGETFESNTAVRKEFFKILYEKSDNKSHVSPESIEANYTKYFYNYYIKTDKYNLKELKDLKITVENEGNILWEKDVYTGLELSPCGFYKLTEEPDFDKIWTVSFGFTDKNNFDNEYETYYSLENHYSLCASYKE